LRPLAISQAEKNIVFRTSQDFDFPAGAILGSTKDARRFQGQPSSLWPSCNLRRGCGVPEELLRLTLPWAFCASTCCWQASIFPTPFYFGQTQAQPPMEVQASPGQKCEGRAAAVSDANSGARCANACSRQPSCSSSTSSRSRSFQRHSRREGSSWTPQKIANFVKFPKFSRTLQNLNACKLITY